VHDYASREVLGRNARELAQKILLDEHATALINSKKKKNSTEGKTSGTGLLIPSKTLIVTLDASSKTPRCVMTIGWGTPPRAGDTRSRTSYASLDEH
jgi:hypothetical protein